MPDALARPVSILVIVAPNFNLAATVGFADPFRVANYLEGRACFAVYVVSEAGGACRASNGVTIETGALAGMRGARPDFVIVSTSWTPEDFGTPALQSALRQWDRQNVTLGGIDTGAFVLAGAGLLEGHAATVHYEHFDAFQEMYPGVAVSEALCVFDRRRITCCGGVAAADCALHIIHATQGAAVANSAARYVFHPNLRPLGAPQNPAEEEPLGKTVPAPVRRAIQAMEAHLEEPLSVPDIARAAKVSHRQLDRLFARHLRKTPALYYRDIRLDRARGLVTQTAMPMAEIAVAAGFASQVHFSRAYRDRFGLPPSRDRTEGRIPFEFRAWPMHRGDGEKRKEKGGKS